jgi:hypothetical protein
MIKMKVARSRSWSSKGDCRSGLGLVAQKQENCKGGKENKKEGSLQGVDATSKRDWQREVFPGFDGKSKLASVYFGNVTTLGKKSEMFMGRRKSHFWGAAETHLDEPKNASVMKRMRFEGWRCTNSVVRRSEDSITGIKGGVMAAARRGMDVTPLKKAVGMPREVVEAEDFTGYVWTTKQVRIVLIFAYFEAGSGLKGRNIRIMQQLHVVLKILKLPF